MNIFPLLQKRINNFFQSFLPHQLSNQILNPRQLSMQEHTAHAVTNPWLFCFFLPISRKIRGSLSHDVELLVMKKSWACVTHNRELELAFPRFCRHGWMQTGREYTQEQKELSAHKNLLKCFWLKQHHKRGSVLAFVSAFILTMSCREGIVVLVVIWTLEWSTYVKNNWIKGLLQFRFWN